MVSVSGRRAAGGPRGSERQRQASRPVKASFQPPSRTAQHDLAEKVHDDAAELHADPAGQALCDNMRELTAHLRGIYHSLSSEDPDPENPTEGHPLVALCDSMRELTAQLRGIFHNLHEDGDGRESGATQRHPLVASLAASLHREALRMLDDGPLEPKMKGPEVHVAPAGLSAAALSGSPRESQGGSTAEVRQASRSFGGRRTRPRPRPGSPKERENLARKRAASRESGPERLKRLGLVGIPKAEKVDGEKVGQTEVTQQTNRQRPRRIAGVEAEKRQTSRRATSERARSKKGSDIEKKAKVSSMVSKMEAEKTRRPQVSPTEATVSTRLAPAAPLEGGKLDGETEDEFQRRNSGGPQAPNPRPRTAPSNERNKSSQREEEQKDKRAKASRESGPERLKRLGLVGIPRKEEVAGKSGTRRLGKAQGEVEEGCAPPTSKRTPIQRTVRSKKMASFALSAQAGGDETAETERRPRSMEESDSMAAMDEDVRRMIEWAAAEAAHTRRVATRVANFQGEGAAHYSIARIRETNQGRLANRLRAATLNRARQARQAMQSMLARQASPRSRQEVSGFRTPGMVDATDIGRQAMDPRWLRQMQLHPDIDEEQLDDTLDQESEMSQDEDMEDEESASFLTMADRQRIGEVLAEQERRRSNRSELPIPPPTATGQRPGRTSGTLWPSFSPSGRQDLPWANDGATQPGPDRHRPPSRGGESWQPLGQTTPPAYEQVTPELLQLWQIQEGMSSQQQEQPHLFPPEVPTEDTHPTVDTEVPVAPESGETHPEVHGDLQGGQDIPDAIDTQDVPETLQRTDEQDAEPIPAEEEAESEIYSEVPGESEVEDIDEGDLPHDLPSVPAAELSVAPGIASVEAAVVAESRRDEQELPSAVEAEKDEVASQNSSESDFVNFEEIEVTELGGFHADEWIVEVSQASSLPQGHKEVTSPVVSKDAGRKNDEAPTAQEVTEEVVSVIMDELINDTVQSSTQAGEPALWHPTPVAPPFIELFNEENAPDGSSAESEPVGQPSPRRPLPQKSVPSSRSSLPVPPVEKGNKGAEVEEDLSEAGRASKDSGPPRPPSPPPDARSLATVSTAPTFPTTSQASPPRPRGKQEQADLISQELLEMLLGEALQEFEETGPADRNLSSPVEEARVSVGSAPSPLIAGPRPIDTSEAVVGPFVDAAFQYFGVVDETLPVSCIPPAEEWLPAVIELMKSKTVAVPTENEEPDEAEEGARAAIEGFTRLMADALLEIATEEVKEQGPRVMGWRRPCFGEAPLARFREKQAQEGQTSSQKQTWEKVRAKLTEQVRFGWRCEGGEETSAVSGVPSGPKTIDLEAGAAGALALANIDEGIDALLEEEICSDEASWLDIKSDVQKVKNEVARMIFTDLVEEMANEIARLWSVPTVPTMMIEEKKVTSN